MCRYSRSSSDTETEPEGTGDPLVSEQRNWVYRATDSDSGLLPTFLSHLLFPFFVLTTPSFHRGPESGDPEEEQP